EGRAESCDVSRRHEQAGLAVDDGITETADVGRDGVPAVCHTPRAPDAEALGVRRAGDDRGPVVETLEFVVRQPAARLGNLRAKRGGAGDDERVALRGL